LNLKVNPEKTAAGDLIQSRHAITDQGQAVSKQKINFGGIAMTRQDQFKTAVPKPKIPVEATITKERRPMVFVHKIFDSKSTTEVETDTSEDEVVFRRGASGVHAPRSAGMFCFCFFCKSFLLALFYGY
jgi:hypothetical protein